VSLTDTCLQSTVKFVRGIRGERIGVAANRGMAPCLVWLLRRLRAPRAAAFLLWVVHPAVAFAPSLAFDRVTAIGTARDHGLARLAACSFHCAAGLPDLFSCRALGLDRI
jgi:hypothetical protein